MKKFAFIVVIILTGFIASAQQKEEKITVATGFLEDLRNENFQEALEKTSPDFRSKMDKEALAGIWQQLTQRFGKLESVGKPTDTSDASSLELNSTFEKYLVPITFNFDSQQQIVGFFIRKNPQQRSPAQALAAVGEGDTINIRVDGGVISGTLTMAKNAKGKVPLVIIIAGSGPTDRNGNNPYAISANSYSKLASALAENGVASYRYDKRLLGASSHFNASERDLVFNDFVDDAVIITNFFKEKPNFSEVVLIGHSEGSNIGLVAAQQALPDKFISLCGPGANFADILRTQLIAQPDLAELAAPIISSLEKEQEVPGRQVPEKLKSLFDPTVQPFVISAFKIDPLEEIKKLAMPILVIGGTTDLQVPISHAEKLQASNPKARLLLIRNMNHVLKTAPKDQQGNLATYQNPNLPVSDDLVIGILNFIQTGTE